MSKLTIELDNIERLTGAKDIEDVLDGLRQMITRTWMETKSPNPKMRAMMSSADISDVVDIPVPETPPGECACAKCTMGRMQEPDRSRWN